MMWERIETDWSRFRHHAKRRWDRLGDNQLEAIAGRRYLLVARIRDAYSITTHEAERQLADWQAQLAKLAEQAKGTS
jgi:uncharacterized protein YjbJ (UPF0337 family)